MKRFALAAALVIAAPVLAQDYVADFSKELDFWKQHAEAGVMKVSVEGASLILENTALENRFSNIHVRRGPEQPGPFEVIARVKIVRGRDDRLAALIWRGWSHEVRFFEWQDIGHYSVYEWTHGAQWKHHRVKPETTHLRQGDFNEIAVRVIGKRAYYAINGVTVDALDLAVGAIPGVGFSLPERTTLQVEALTARAIPSTGDALAGLTRKYEAEAAEHHKLAGVVPHVDKTVEVPFVEDFNDNAAGWAQPRGQSEGHIRDGVFEYAYYVAEPNWATWVTKRLVRKLSGDYEIALSLAHLEGPNEAEAGLFFDGNDQGQRKVFQITRTHFRYYAFDGKTWDNQTDAWSTTTAVNSGPGARNELIVRALGGRAYFVLNGKPVHAVPHAGMTGDIVGVSLGAGTLARFDRLSLKPLSLTDAARTAEMKRLDAEVRTARIAAGPELKDFVETFDTNERGWWVNSGDTWSALLEKGELLWHNKKADGTYFTRQHVPLNQEADYDLTLRGRWVGGRDSHMIGLMWGNSPDSREHNAFAFSGNRQWVVSGFRGGNFVTLLPWRPSSLLKAAEANELTVRKIDDTVFFVINGQVVADLPVERLRGENLGFEVGPGVHGAVDEIRLTYPRRTAEAAAQEKAKLLAQLEANHRNKELGATHSGLAKKEAAEKEQARIAATQPSKADWAEVDKLSRRYVNKKMLSVIADRGQPARMDGTEANPILYYFYKTIGGVTYDLEFICVYTGGTGKIDRQAVIVNSVFLKAR